MGTSWLEIEQSSAAVEGALAKVSRVLPLRARERLQAMTEHLVFFAPQQATRPDVSLFITLSKAIGQQRRIAIAYRSRYDEVTHRTVEPYGMVGWDGHWYLVGYCCLRQAHRTFRLDRIQQVEALAEPFERPEGFDCRAYIIEKYARKSPRWQVVVEFQAPLYMVQQKIPASYGRFAATPGGALIECQTENLEGQARYLMSLNVPFVIHQPPEGAAASGRADAPDCSRSCSCSRNLAVLTLPLGMSHSSNAIARELLSKRFHRSAITIRTY